MAALTPALERDIGRLIARLARRLPVDAVVLFGSRARGDALQGSDVDLAVVSSGLEGIPPLARMELLFALWPGATAADIVGLTPQELRRRRDELSVVGEIAREGRLLHGRWPWDP